MAQITRAGRSSEVRIRRGLTADERRWTPMGGSDGVRGEMSQGGSQNVVANRCSQFWHWAIWSFELQSSFGIRTSTFPRAVAGARAMPRRGGSQERTKPEVRMQKLEVRSGAGIGIRICTLGIPAHLSGERDMPRRGVELREQPISQPCCMPRRGVEPLWV